MVLAKLKDLSRPITNNLIGVTGQRTLEVTEPRRRAGAPAADRGGHNRAHPGDDRAVDPDHQKRIKASALWSPPSSARGRTGFSCRSPASGGPQELIDLIGKTAKLEFRLVNSHPGAQALQSGVPADSGNPVADGPEGQTLQGVAWRADSPGRQGASWLGCGPSQARRLRPERPAGGGFPVQVGWRGSSAGYTAENVGRPFAIVLDKR